MENDSGNLRFDQRIKCLVNREPDFFSRLVCQYLFRPAIMLWFVVVFTFHHAAFATGADVDADIQRSYIVRGDQNYRPYEFINSKGEPDGFNVELIRAIAEELGLDISITLGPWSEVRQELEQGKIDALMGVMISEARAEKIIFGIPHSVMTHGIFTHAEKKYKSLDELQGKEIVVQNGDIMHDFLLENGLTDKIIPAIDQLEALKLLEAGKHDAALLGNFQGLHLIREHNLRQVKMRSSGIAPQRYAMAVSQGNDELMWLLNHGLYQLKVNGTYDNIYTKWFTIYEDYFFFKKHRIAIIALAVALGAFILFLIALRLQVRRNIRKWKKSELNFQKLIESVPVAIVVSDLDENVKIANKKFVEMFGYTKEEHKSVNDWWYLAYPDERYRNTVKEKWGASMQNARESNTDISPQEVRVTCKNGDIKYVEVGFMPLDSLNVITFVDITGHKELEIVLKEKSEELERYFNSSLDLLCIANTEGRLLRLNPEWEKVLGYKIEELQGEYFIDFVHPDDTEATRMATHQLKDQEDVLSFTNRYRCKNGSYRWIEWRSKPVGHKIYAVARDITDRIAIEHQLKINNTELQKLNAQKDKFFSIIAHDLRSPFNSIMGFSQLLVDQINEKDYEGIEQYARIIRQSSEHAMNLLTNLLEWSFSQTGRIEFKPEYFELINFLEKTIPVFDDVARQKSITITRSLPHNIPVYADKHMISTVLRNLISNAIKFTRQGGEVIVSAQRAKSEVIVSVKDNGVGIPKDQVDKLFRIDEGESTPGTNNEQGTGLGLILCKEFVEKHGGKIWVESTENAGSAFTFTLPQQ